MRGYTQILSATLHCWLANGPCPITTQLHSQLFNKNSYRFKKKKITCQRSTSWYSCLVELKNYYDTSSNVYFEDLVGDHQSKVDLYANHSMSQVNIMIPGHVSFRAHLVQSP